MKCASALVEASFPKRCANCGAVYPDAHSFIADTLPISPDRTGLIAYYVADRLQPACLSMRTATGTLPRVRRTRPVWQ